MSNYADILLNIVDNSINYFDEIYHSAEILINDKGIKKPVITKNNEWVSLVPTDQREIIYIRRAGDDLRAESLGIGSCIKSYKMSTPLRLVYFKDHSKDPDRALSNLMQSILVTGTLLKSICRDKYKLLKDESSGDYNFGPATAYFAIDFIMFWTLTPSSCQDDFCIDIPNPYKKELCLVAV